MNKGIYIAELTDARDSNRVQDFKLPLILADITGILVYPQITAVDIGMPPAAPYIENLGNVSLLFNNGSSMIIEKMPVIWHFAFNEIMPFSYLNENKGYYVKSVLFTKDLYNLEEKIEKNTILRIVWIQNKVIRQSTLDYLGSNSYNVKVCIEYKKRK